MTTLVDTHAHLLDGRFDVDRDAVLARAAAAGTWVVNVSVDLDTSRRGVECARRHATLFTAVGVYPHETAGLTDADWDELATLARDPAVVGIGEIGLDYHWKTVDHATQQRAFDRLLELALTVKKPALVHIRDSEEDVMARLEAFGRAGGVAVWHCYSPQKGTATAMLERALAAGVYFAVAGGATCDDRKTLRAMISKIPDDRLLLETDCPYQIPRPRDTDRNEPALLGRTAAAVAALRGVLPEDIARVTTVNACDIFGLAPPEEYAGGRPVYAIRDKLYVALTNDCNNSCTFCSRNHSWTVKGHDVRLPQEPTADEVIAGLGDLTPWTEVVFCGFGECTLRLETLKQVAEYVHAQGKPVRLNTNGLANAYFKRDVAAELVGYVDTVSVSLNTADPAQYAALCRPTVADGHAAVCAFIRACVAAGLDTVATVVAAPGIDIEAARRLAESLGATFRVRAYNDVG